MKRPTFITMSTLVLTIVAYVGLAQMAPADAAPFGAMPGDTSAALEILRVQGR